jgi:hypothetical protein
MTSIVTDTGRKPTCAARAMTPRQRIELAIESLGGRRCVCRLADAHDVSRKFVYQQQAKAQGALESAFAPPPASDPDVLFHLPITGAWLRQFALVAVLVGHSSQRGVCEMLDCLLGLPVSLGWVHSVVADAIDKARPISDAQDLSRVGAIALDEIFQGQKPVLAVVDVASTYCCLLSQEERRDADTWAVRLLELQDQGLAPRQAVADFGNGLRAGSRIALPWLSCDADVWHPLRDFGEAVRFLENRAYGAIETCDKLLRKAGVPAGQIQAAEGERDEAIALADDVALLARWLRQDVLSLAGPWQERRHELLGFVLKELQKRRPSCEHRLGPLCSMLASQGEALLGFCARLDGEIADLALYAKVSEAVVREVVTIQEMAQTGGRRWRREGALRGHLGSDRYEALWAQVEALRQGVVRASSVVENLNSRLRSYFFLRKEIGGGYLDLLRFLLNHRRFLRSEHPERVGKSPAELLSGKEHPHWLEMLGYRRSSQDQAAA